MQFNDLILRFVYESIPLPEVAEEIKFEAVSAEVFGTKQRRFGPLPIPEIQTEIRSVIRRSNSRVLHFFMPWASKQAKGMNLDVAEFVALKQLRCLQEGLRRYGYDAKFSFRMEDNTDMFIFGEERNKQIRTYANTFQQLTKALLPNSEVRRESWEVSPCDFHTNAHGVTPIFYKYLKGETSSESIAKIGWIGTIPFEQREYYLRQYRIFYSTKDHLWELAKYFAATLTRVKMKATCVPTDDHICLAFTHPIPGNPVNKARLYYRTIPERWTHTHKSPWLAKGIFRIGDTDVTPRFYDNEPKLVKNVIEYGGVSIEADFILE